MSTIVFYVDRVTGAVGLGGSKVVERVLALDPTRMVRSDSEEGKAILERVEREDVQLARRNAAFTVGALRRRCLAELVRDTEVTKAQRRVYKARWGRNWRRKLAEQTMRKLDKDAARAARRPPTYTIERKGLDGEVTTHSGLTIQQVNQLVDPLRVSRTEDGRLVFDELAELGETCTGCGIGHDPAFPCPVDAIATSPGPDFTPEGMVEAVESAAANADERHAAEMERLAKIGAVAMGEAPATLEVEEYAAEFPEDAAACAAPPAFTGDVNSLEEYLRRTEGAQQ